MSKKKQKFPSQSSQLDANNSEQKDKMCGKPSKSHVNDHKQANTSQTIIVRSICNGNTTNVAIFGTRTNAQSKSEDAEKIPVDWNFSA